VSGQALIEKMGVSNEKIGKYSGAIDSIYACTQTAAIIFWPKVSAVYGHKTVLCVCLLGLALSSLAFGLSTKIWQLLFWRGVSGLFGASTLSKWIAGRDLAFSLTNEAAVRIIAGEITAKDTAPRAYSLLNVIASVVYTVSPVAGAFLFTSGHSTLRPAFPPACFNALLGGWAFLTTFYCLQGHAARRPGNAAQYKVNIGFVQLLRSPGAALAVTLCTANWVLATAFGSGERAVSPTFTPLP
jgi:MFS family permease